MRVSAKRERTPDILEVEEMHLLLLENWGPTRRCRGTHFATRFLRLLKGNGEDVKVVQELLRHSTAKMTRDAYTQALSPQKRAAQSNVVGMIRSTPSCNVVVPRVSGEIPVTH